MGSMDLCVVTVCSAAVSPPRGAVRGGQCISVGSMYLYWGHWVGAISLCLHYGAQCERMCGYQCIPMGSLCDCSVDISPPGGAVRVGSMHLYGLLFGCSVAVSPLGGAVTLEIFMRDFSSLQPGRELRYPYGGHWGLYGGFGVFLGGYWGPPGVTWTPGRFWSFLRILRAFLRGFPPPGIFITPPSPLLDGFWSHSEGFGAFGWGCGLFWGC